MQRCNDAPYNALHCRCTEPRHKALLARRGPRLGHAVAFAQTHAQAGQRIRADCSAALVVQANGGASAPSSGPGTSGNTCPAMPLRHTRHLLVGYARTARRCESPPLAHAPWLMDASCTQSALSATTYRMRLSRTTHNVSAAAGKCIMGHNIRMLFYKTIRIQP